MMASSWTPADMPDMEGKVVVVTGANRGLGRQTAKHLASHGAKVYFTARSEAKAEQAREYVLEQHPSISSNLLIWLQMDLADIRSIQRAAEVLMSKEEKIDILINNAFCASDEMEMTAAGWEMDFAVNHIGTFVFINALMPLLKETALQPGSDVRIINLNTGGIRAMIPPDFPLDFSSPSLFSGRLPYEPWHWRWIGQYIFKFHMTRYLVSKLGLAMLTVDLQRRLDEAGIPIMCVSLHPGGTKTEGLLGANRWVMLPIVHLFFLTEDQGSWHTLYRATDGEMRRAFEENKGKYFEAVGGASHPGHPYMQDPMKTRAVWDMTQKEVDEYLEKSDLTPLLRW